MDCGASAVLGAGAKWYTKQTTVPALMEMAFWTH